MAKAIDEKLTKGVDWNGYSGKRVQEFITEELETLDKGKVGYVLEDDGYFYFSSSEEEFDNGNHIAKIKAGDPRYILKTYIPMDNRTIFFSSENSKHFVWYFKTEDRIDTTSNFTESVNVDYIINNTTIGKPEQFSTVITPLPINNMSGFTKVDMNLDEYLKDGVSNIQVNLTAPISKQKTTFNFTINIIKLETEDITEFHTLQKDNFEIRNNILCTTGQLYFLEYRFDGGDFNTYNTETLTGNGKREPRSFTINYPKNFNDGRHVCEYRFYLGLDGHQYFTDIQRIEFIKGTKDSLSFKEPQILISSIYKESDDIIADDNNLIINGITQYVPYIMKYAVYNPKGLTNIEIKDDVMTFSDSVKSNTFASYNFQSTTSGVKKIIIFAVDDKGNILNSEGRTVYLNVDNSELGINIYNTNLRIDFSSIGKKNVPEDKKNWVSYVSEYNYTTIATFNEEFDWSQGWTDNGLVISNGSEVTFDYVPFPKNISENKYIVGGDKGFVMEIEFMTKNVIDDEAVVCDMFTVNGTGGLQITGSEIKFVVPGGKEEVSSRFKPEEMNRAVIIIRPQEGKDENGNPAFRGLIELYMNGILSSIAKYTKDTVFQILDQDKLSTFGKKLSFRGSEGADIVLKYIRTYNGVMSPDDVVNNYILFRDKSSDMLNLHIKNNVMNEQGVITPESIEKWGKIPFLVFIGRTKTTLENEPVKSEYAPGAGEGETHNGQIVLDNENWYQTLENTTDKKKVVNMDVIYCNPIDPAKNFKFVNAYITPQGTSSMYYPKKNYRIYTQKNSDTRCFFSKSKEEQLTYDMMKKSNFGVNIDDWNYEPYPGIANKSKRVYSFKKNSQEVKCWCLKADFAETSSSHNTGIARLWGDTLKNSTIKFGEEDIRVFETAAQSTIRKKFNNNINGDMPDIRTTIDGFPIVVFGARSYDDPITFLGQYNFNNDKSTESVFGFCDIDNEEPLDNEGKDNYTGEITNVNHTLDKMLDQYMTCVETLDNGNLLANFATLESFNKIIEVDKNKNDIYGWEKAFEFRYPEKPDKKDYKGKEAKFEEDYKSWHNTHVKPFRHFAEWLYSTRWCDVNGHILKDELEAIINKVDENGNPIIIQDESGNNITTAQQLANYRKRKFEKEKWEHLDIWKVAAYYIYLMRFGAVDQVVKNSMLTSEGPFAYDKEGNYYGYLDTTDINKDKYGLYYKWYFINYDNDTIMGVKNDGHLAFGPEINRKSVEGINNFPIYAGSNSTLWNNLDADEEFQSIIEKVDQGISENLTYEATINMFDVQQVGMWCERIYNKDAEYKYITPYVGGWLYRDDKGNTSEDAGNFSDKLFMLQGARTAHRRWWLSRRFSLYDGKWGAGDFLTKFIVAKCDYSSIGDTFSAVAGTNAFFGYRINNQTFDNGSPEGGSTTEYKAKDIINWQLFKNVNIGDPIALYGVNDMVEINLQGLSKGLATLEFQFGSNDDLGNKMERLILSIPEEELLKSYSYKIFGDDDTNQTDALTAFEKLQLEYPDIKEKDFEENKYPTVDSELEANASSPEFYRILDNGRYIYFAKIGGGVRNSSCKELTLTNLTKLQVLKIAGYVGLSKIDLTNNNSLNELDARYSGIKSFTFNNSKIKNLSASTSLEELFVNSCDNLKLSNISIDSVPLKDDMGVRLKTISIDKSTGLNSNALFKDFIITWMNGGNEFIETKFKKLNLTDIHWKGVTMKEIRSIIKFKYGNTIPEIGSEQRASECKITGILEMGNVNFSQSDIDLINALNNKNDINLTIKYPYANILIKSPKSMVAGQTIIVSSKIESDNSANTESNIVNYVFVEETKAQNAELVDYNTGKRYNIIKEESLTSIRNGAITIENNESERTAIITVSETICNEDTSMLIAAVFNVGGESKFDIANLIIKDPTYAVSGVIDGTTSLNESGMTYDYNLLLATDKGYEPIGTMDITWSLSGEGLNYIESYEISDNNKLLKIKTRKEMPNLEILTATLDIEVLIKNYKGVSDIYEDVNIVKTVLLLNETIILTNVSNKEVMKVCADQGWSEGNERALTKEQAANIEDIGQAFSGLSNTKWSFDEFEYFTKVSVLSDNAFAGSKLTSIVLPSSVTKIGKNIFEGCTELKKVVLSENIDKIPFKTFHGCYNLEYLTIPDKVSVIETNAFGGVGVKRILFKDIETNTPKTIYLSRQSQLSVIYSDAFESSAWTITRGSESSTIESTNVLKEVSIPKNLNLGPNQYNFLLSPELSKINIENLGNGPYLEGNILYVDNSKQSIARALVNSDNFDDELNLSNVSRIYNYAFYNCNCIDKIIFGQPLQGFGIGVGAFYGSKIKEINLEKATALISLEDFTFYNATSLETILLPNNGNLCKLGYQLFVNCPLTNGVALPDTIEYCETLALNLPYGRQFYNCGITNLELPDKLIELPSYFIDGCNKLTTLTFGKYYNISDGTNTVVSRCNSLKTINLPLYSTTLSGNSYYVNIIKNGIKRVKSGPHATLSIANVDMNNLMKLNTYDSATTEYVVEEFVTGSDIIINTELFKKGRLELFDECHNLNEYNLQETDNNKIFAKDEDGNIYRSGYIGNDGSIVLDNHTLVKVTNSTVTYSVPEKYTVIEDGAFAHNSKLTEVTLHNNITNIGEGTFSYCTAIAKIDIKSLNIDTIKYDMFANCSSLKTVLLPENLKTIGPQVFMGCSNLENIIIPENVGTISSYLFNNCTKLKNIVLPKNVKYIEQYAFYDCTSLASVKILSRELAYINWFAFCGCKNLSEILLLNISAPEVLTGDEYYKETYKDENDNEIFVKKFHPFGYNYSTFVGSISSNNILYLPYKASGYTVENWEIPLKKISKFNINTITLDNSCILKGNILENKSLIYFKSERGEFTNNGGVESSTNENGVFNINFNNKVYDNEIIYIYSDKDCTNKIGEFVTEYGKDEYILDDVIMGSSNTRSMFNTNLFEDENKINNTDVEMANITKLEYDILVSRVNQLMKLLNKK